MAEHWKNLLARAVEDDPRGRAGVAEKIGYHRSAVSQALSGTYAAKMDKIAQAVLDHYDRPDCILVGRVIERPLCRRTALIAEPKGGDARVRWLTCQTCPHKPQE
ncbi:MAG: hypothetical protein ACOZB0_04730 [Pseudomonadota bacterium]